jgi:hypothetical protein
MVKSSENIVATDPPQVTFQPVPQQSKITITVRATIPTQQYGNLTLEHVHG